MYLLEIFALSDLISDFLVFIMIINTNNAGWATTSLICMIAPYFIIYSPLVTVLTKNNAFETESSARQVLGSLFLSILAIVMIFLIDILCVLVKVLIPPINYFLHYFSFTYIEIYNISNLQDNIF